MGDITDDVSARLAQRIRSPADLLVFKLGSARKVENKLLWTLDALASEAESIDVKDVLHHHVQESKMHGLTLGRLLKALGADTDDEQPAPSFEGIDKDTSTNAEHASEELGDAVILSGAAEIEHHEIAVYETLTGLSEALGEREVLDALRPILEEEQRQLSHVNDAYHESVKDLEMDGSDEEEGLLSTVKRKISEEITSPRDLLKFDLGVALHMEQTILEMLHQLQDHAQGDKLKLKLHEHAEETEGHIENVERAFAALDAEPQKKPCKAVNGLQKESETSLKITRGEMLDSVILAGAAETEHYEIAVYEALITLADSLGADDALAALRENLTQERLMLKTVTDTMLTEARVRAGQA
ncbi:MAG TPA: DUF892 family protein [Solirubrobacteraceae bacterium]|nr:DUF892 family protein [Solirubrobacteraceae bacterium]